MTKPKPLAAWLEERGLDAERLGDLVALDRRVLEALVAGRYTPSPQQRRLVASALDLSPEEIAWGHRTEVDHMYGHGPQFGRSP